MARQSSGIGIVILLVVVWIFFSQNSCTQKKEETQIRAKRKASPLLQPWKICVLNEMEKFRGKNVKGWSKWEKTFNKCRKDIAAKLNVESFKNKDEKKYHILPKIALGEVEFFGADPIVEINEELYSEIGKFFPFAVSDQTGYTNASVMTDDASKKYFTKLVVSLELVYFLKQMIKKKFYDAILMDAEYAEFGLFPYITRGGQLDKNGIVVCQWNMEIHRPTPEQKKLGHDFLFQILEDERYAILYADCPTGHYRMYLLNFEDEQCQRKYFPTEWQSWTQ